MSTKTPQDIALAKAKIGLMARPDSVFFATICFSMKHLWDESVPTAATDGLTVKYNPKFFMSLTPDERIFLLIHESMHPAYLHIDPVRMNGRNHKKWNAAADFVINLQLVERGFTMPANGLLNHGFANMSVEEIYNKLPDSQQCPMLDLQPSKENPDKLKQDVQEILIRAAIQSKMAGDKAGTIPGDIQLFLDNLLDPKLPWNRILQKYLMTYSKNDYSFKRPNRRYFPQHYLPSLYSINLDDLVIAVDISGSVMDHEFHQFVSETASIFKMMQPKNIELIQFDYQLQSIDQVRNINELMRIKFTGRGGTDIRELMQHVNKTKPRVLMVFTDGEFYWPDVQPSCDVIWLIHNNKNFTAPYGKVIHYEIENHAHS